ncbi:hypothetical protein D3C87_1881590 [compost metagenome]
MGAHRVVGQRLAEQGLRGKAQPRQVEVESAHPAAAHLHGREVGVAGEGERRQGLGSCRLAVALHDESGRGRDAGGHGFVAPGSDGSSSS